MNTAIKPITPEREQELVAKLVDFLSSRYDAGNLYDILRHGLGMDHSDTPMSTRNSNAAASP